MDQLQQAKILIADDSAVMRVQLRHSLEELNLGTVIDAENGLSAWDELQRDDFHCLVLDWEMPGLDGIQLLERIRKDEKLKDLPVLMITIHSDQKKIMQAMQQGVKGYIIKPMNSQILQNKVLEILKEAPTLPHL